MSLPVHVGLGLITCQRYPGDRRSDAALYREALEIAAYADELGFDSVWTSEHHFADDAYMPALLPMMAAIAARTSKIQIGSAVLIAPLFHPFRLAEDAATVDLISGGRLILGLGLGWLRWQFDAFGVDLAHRVPRTVETIEILRQAWSSGYVEHRGQLFDLRAIPVTPKPARPGGPPIWLGAEAPRAIRRAGALADGWLTDMPTPAEFTPQVNQLALGAKESSRTIDDIWIGGIWPTYVASSFEAAWAEVGGLFSHRIWKSADYRSRPGHVDLERAPLPSRTDLADQQSRLVAGDERVVLERIRTLRTSAGRRFVYIARLLYPGLSLERQRQAVRRFATEVMPLLRSPSEPPRVGPTPA